MGKFDILEEEETKEVINTAPLKENTSNTVSQKGRTKTTTIKKGLSSYYTMDIIIGLQKLSSLKDRSVAYLIQEAVKEVYGEDIEKIIEDYNTLDNQSLEDELLTILPDNKRGKSDKEDFLNYINKG